MIKSQGASHSQLNYDCVLKLDVRGPDLGCVTSFLLHEAMRIGFYPVNGLKNIFSFHFFIVGCMYILTLCLFQKNWNVGVSASSSD